MEATLNANGFKCNFGFCNSSYSLADGAAVPGEDGFFSNAMSIGSNDGIWHQGSGNGGTPFSGGFAVGDTVDIALDLGNTHVWCRKNNGAWNPNIGGTQDPATNQGGILVQDIAASPYFAVGYGFNSSDSVTARFSSSSWLHTAPSGFNAIP
jgi:hypothetical protein